MDSITRNHPENQVQSVQAHGLLSGESPLSHSHTSGHLSWAKARLLQGPLEPSLSQSNPGKVQPMHNATELKPVHLFLRVRFNHFHKWFLEVCRVPACCF